jgi:hypothetical protein
MHRKHTAHCWELTGFKYMHDLIRDVLFDTFRCAKISTKKETPWISLTDPQERRLTLQSTDVLVRGWVEGKHACVDLTEVSRLVGLMTRDFTVGDNPKCRFKQGGKHMRKHAPPEVVDLLKRVQWVMHSNIMSPRSMNVVFWKIDFVIQKSLVAQLIARLPFIHM